MSLAQFMHTMQQIGQQPSLGQRFMQGQQQAREMEYQGLQRQQLQQQIESEEFERDLQSRWANAAQDPERQDEAVALGLQSTNPHILGTALSQRYPKSAAAQTNMAKANQDLNEGLISQEQHAVIMQQEQRKAEERGGTHISIDMGQPGQKGTTLGFDPRTSPGEERTPIRYDENLNVSNAEEVALRNTMSAHARTESTIHGMRDYIEENMQGMTATSFKNKHQQVLKGMHVQLMLEIKELEEMGVITASDAELLSGLIPDPTTWSSRVTEYLDPGAMQERFDQFEKFVGRRVTTMFNTYGVEGYEPRSWQRPGERDRDTTGRPTIPQDPNQRWEDLRAANPNMDHAELLEEGKKAGVLPRDYTPPPPPGGARRGARGGATNTRVSPTPQQEAQATPVPTPQQLEPTPTPPPPTGRPEVAPGYAPDRPPPEVDPVEEAVSIYQEQLDTKAMTKEEAEQSLRELLAEEVITQREFARIMRELGLGSHSAPAADIRLGGM